MSGALLKVDSIDAALYKLAPPCQMLVSVPVKCESCLDGLYAIRTLMNSYSICFAGLDAEPSQKEANVILGARLKVYSIDVSPIKLSHLVK